MLFFECFSVAIVAWVFYEILTGPGMVFEFWYEWLNDLNSRGMAWLAKPLGFCGVCFTGQIGFWWYLFSHRWDWILGEHIIFTCQTIAFYLAIKRTSDITKAWLNKQTKG